MLKRLFAATVLLALDQWSKAWALATLMPGTSMTLLPGVQFTLAMNRGIAFSQFNSVSGWAYALLLLVITLIALTVFTLMLRSQGKWVTTGWVLLSAGAFGNLVDRLHHGYIVDFIDLYVQQWHWPVFNIADIQIFLGVCVLAVIWCKQEKCSV
ncbi:MAG: signal peptidase II [Legionellales bacterium]|nr:signal peptidase II [Legionellales bacterium]